MKKIFATALTAMSFYSLYVRTGFITLRKTVRYQQKNGQKDKT